MIDLKKINDAQHEHMNMCPPPTLINLLRPLHKNNWFQNTIYWVEHEYLNMCPLSQLSSRVLAHYADITDFLCDSKFEHQKFEQFSDLIPLLNQTMTKKN